MAHHEAQYPHERPDDVIVIVVVMLCEPCKLGAVNKLNQFQSSFHLSFAVLVCKVL